MIGFFKKSITILLFVNTHSLLYRQNDAYENKNSTQFFTREMLHPLALKFIFISMYNRPSMFQGRNGSDQLSVFLVFLALILVIIYPFFTLSIVRLILIIIALALCGIALFRMLSENVAKRRYENERFLSLFRKKSSSSRVDDATFKEANAKDERKAKKEEIKREKEEKKAEEKRMKEAKKENMKTYAYFNCPKCKTELRVPKGKGKILITCPKCGEKFEEKT